MLRGFGCCNWAKLAVSPCFQSLSKHGCRLIFQQTWERCRSSHLTLREEGSMSNNFFRPQDSPVCRSGCGESDSTDQKDNIRRKSQQEVWFYHPQSPPGAVWMHSLHLLLLVRDKTREWILAVWHWQSEFVCVDVFCALHSSFGVTSCALKPLFSSSPPLISSWASATFTYSLLI